MEGNLLAWGRLPLVIQGSAIRSAGPHKAEDYMSGGL
jgi:hypothetical protein